MKIVLDHAGNELIVAVSFDAFALKELLAVFAVIASALVWLFGCKKRSIVSAKYQDVDIQTDETPMTWLSSSERISVSETVIRARVKAYLRSVQFTVYKSAKKVHIYQPCSGSNFADPNDSFDIRICLHCVNKATSQGFPV